jgi:hypothetical protein
VPQECTVPPRNPTQIRLCKSTTQCESLADRIEQLIRELAVGFVNILVVSKSEINFVKRRLLPCGGAGLFSSSNSVQSN